MVPVLIFFLNMRETHRVLVTEKNRQLETLQQRILLYCRRLMERLDGAESTAGLASEINALVAYEERLRQARTWPYNTAMLRTLFVSVIIPGGAAVAGFLADLWFR